jgi:hypothetical protein
MRRVNGFIASDGTFFETADQCEFYEANYALDYAVRAIGADPDKFRIVVNGCASQVRRYLDAKEAFEKAEYADGGAWAARAEPAAPSDLDRARHGEATRDATSVQQQPADSDQHVSDVGSGERAEAVSNERSEHGAGVRSALARSLRGSTSVAANQAPGFAVTRGVNSGSIVRDSEK